MINATGPFADGVRRLSDPGAKPMIMASAGVHVTLPDYYSPEQNLGMIVPKTKDGRVVFMLPWLEATIAGTTGAHARSLCCGEHLLACGASRPLLSVTSGATELLRWRCGVGQPMHLEWQWMLQSCCPMRARGSCFAADCRQCHTGY